MTPLYEPSLCPPPKWYAACPDASNAGDQNVENALRTQFEPRNPGAGFDIPPEYTQASKLVFGSCVHVPPEPIGVSALTHDGILGSGATLTLTDPLVPPQLTL